MYILINMYIKQTHQKQNTKTFKPHRKRKADITAGMKSMLRETRN